MGLSFSHKTYRPSPTARDVTKKDPPLIRGPLIGGLLYSQLVINSLVIEIIYWPTPSYLNLLLTQKQALRLALTLVYVPHEMGSFQLLSAGDTGR
jgi:hypothetical protein